ncbi:sulfurtransferase [Smaragdicoccus niigatensis]|uniref:sulfurtransferase n=1 Tax=Smaragdicoccus niigatensis TaxID=359359 RepID=UPI00036D54D1|nr:rhodanese-like domain-containing protein [Smaragdicoccus niigatensis]
MSNRVVSTEWLSANLGNPHVRIIAAAPNPRSFSIGHIPGAARLACSQMFDASQGDFVESKAFAAIVGKLGIRRNDSIVLYGDPDNSSAALLMWLFTMFGHTNVSILDGGRGAWLGDDRETEFEPADWSPSDYPAIPRTDAPHRISRDELHRLFGKVTILDTRAESEFIGDVDASDEVTRTGHIPTSISVPASALRDSAGRFLDSATLRERLVDLRDDRPVIVYDRTAARAAETWLVLRFLLDWNDVRVYDGGWNEWGNSFGLPVLQGPQP